jgi:arylsulfatase A-like enzyme
VSIREPESTESEAVNVLLVSVWFGLVSGLIEGLAFLGVQQFGSSQQVSIEIVWVSAAFNFVMFGAIGIVLEAINRFGLRRVHLDFAVVPFVFLACLDWLGVTLRTWIHPAAILILAIGLTVLFRRWFRSHEAVATRFWRASLPVIIVLVLVVGGAIQGGFWLRERMSTASLPKATATVPNILVLVVDALRADHLSTYGYVRRTSPNLDRLADTGVLFEHAFATSSWTLPSHVSLLTGLYPSQHGVGWETPKGLLTLGYPTLPEALSAHGYRTAAFSANVFWFTRDRGFDRGFIHFEDYFSSLADMVSRPFYGRLVERFVLRRLGFEDFPGRKRASDINHALLRWIDADRSRPFFVFVNYMDTHDPYLPPQPYRSRFSRAKDPGGMINWWVGRHPKLGPEEVQGEIDAYDGAISYVDDSIGQLVAELHRRDPSGNTLVVITSDHGESFGEHGLFLHGNTLYRNEIQVPLIVSWRGRIPAGARIEQPVTNAALPATVMDLIGVDDRARFPGPSLALAWKAPQSRNWPDPIAEVEEIPWLQKTAPASQGSIKSLVGIPWQYVEHEKWGAEFYDWRNDPEALHNLAHQPAMQSEIGRFRRALDQRLRQKSAKSEKVR